MKYVDAATTAEKIRDKFNIPMAELVDVFAEIPAADVQPIKHGRWENTSTPNQLRCSKCEVIHFIAQYPHGKINFCPNCGSKMEGDTE